MSDIDHVAGKRRRIISLLALGAAAFCFGSSAHAQAYPNHTIKLVVPFAPGGGSDAVARVIAHALSERLGQQVYVENRPGAGGSIGAGMVAKSEPDGYTLLLGSTSEIVQYPIMSTRKPYDATKAFAPIGMVGVVPMALIVGKDLPVNSVQDVIRYAKANPGKINFGSGGTGTATHLAVELFAASTGIKMTHVPYKGSAAVIPDMLNGNLQLAMSLVPGVIPYADGRANLKVLAVSTAKRAPTLASVPTMQEAGVKDYDTSLWTGLLAAAGTPKEIVAKLSSELTAALANPEVRSALARQGAEATPSTPAQFAARIGAEQKSWSALINEAGIKID
jgi:tripartite-type tricarboxylate transporter receptor subunit TctC